MENNRVYKLWHYTVSHGMLLIRSPKSSAHPYNIDCLFAAVTHIDCPYKMTNLVVEEKQVLSKYVSVFRLQCDEGLFEIHALTVQRNENQLDFMDVSPYVV